MTDATQKFTRGDGSFDVFGAVEHGQLLHRRAINISLRGLLARLSNRFRRTSSESAGPPIELSRPTPIR